MRSKLDLFILRLKALGVGNLLKFDFLIRPRKSYLVNAIESLFSLKIIDKQLNLTKLGGIVAEMPLSPVHGVLLVNSASEIF